MKIAKFFKRFYLGLVLLFLYMPILMLMVFSFNGGDNVKWSGFSLQWYQELFNDPAIIDAIWVTVSIAILSSLIAVVIGTLAAIGIKEYKRVSRSPSST